MVTTEARYQQVVDALDESVDDYVLKPVKQRAFEARVLQALRRKGHLRPVYEAIDSKNLDLASRTCQALYAAKGPHSLAAAKLGADLLMSRGQHALAKDFLKTVEPASPPTWVRLAVAKTLLESAEPKEARQVLDELLTLEPDSADGQDLLARACLDDALFEQALAASERAVRATPGSCTRHQRHGALLQLGGDAKQAHVYLEKALSLGRGSRSLNLLGLVQLALACFDNDEPKPCERARHRLSQAAVAAEPERAAHASVLLELLEHLASGDHRAFVAACSQLAEPLRAASFDFEAARVLLLLLSRGLAAGVTLDAPLPTARQLALRFAATKANVLLLEMACKGCDALTAVVREAAEAVNALAQAALAHVLAGDVLQAVESLLQHYEETRNGRFLALARACLDKHTANIAPEVADRLRHLVAKASGLCTDEPVRLRAPQATPVAPAPGGPRRADEFDIPAEHLALLNVA